MLLLKLENFRLLNSSFIALFIFYFCGCSSQKHKSNNPHVLFIMVDDLRDWTGYSTHFSEVITPNLNKLANRGLVFKNAYCSAPVCAASRTAILSGMSPANTGVYENGQLWEGKLTEAVTLTQKFMQSGYHVAGFGKIYHGQGKTPNWHEYVYGDYSPLPEKYENFYALGNPLNVHDSLTGDWKRVSNAIKVLESDIDQPLFLACGLVRPHTPWNVPAEYFNMYYKDSIDLPKILEGDLSDIPNIGKTIAERKHKDQYGKSIEWTHQAILDSGLWKTNIRAYLASITYADAQIGRLLEAWQQSEYSKNGIIVLMGDHGWHHGEKEHWSKRTLWEEGTKTPLIFAGKGLIPEKSACDQPVSLLDIYPTLVGLCNFEDEPHLDGTSLQALIANPEAEREEPAITIWGKDNVSIRYKNWRYINYCDGSKELYDLTTDKNEWENVVMLDSTRYADVIGNMQKWIPNCSAPAKFKKGRTSWFESSGIKELCNN